MEKTLVLIKPRVIKRGLLGKIITIYEDKGLEITRIRMARPSKEMLEEHYAEHKGKPFFPELIEYMSCGPVCAMELQGEDVIRVVRKLNGATDPLKAEAGTIRARFAISKSVNAVHASDSVESANRELEIWFGK